MPQSYLVYSQNNNDVFQTISVGTVFIGLSAYINGLGNPALQLGNCTGPHGENFTSVIELDCVTGTIRVSGTAVMVP